MQKRIFNLVIFLFLFFAPVQVMANCIWESIETGKDFDFKGFDKVFLFVTLVPDQAERELKDILKKSLQGRGQLLLIHDLQNQIIGALGESSLFMYVTYMPTEDPNVNGLSISAAAGAKTTRNESHFLGTVWQRTYFFKGCKTIEEDLSRALKESINLLLTQYFKTNTQAKGRAVFYLPEIVSNPSKTNS